MRQARKDILANLKVASPERRMVKMKAINNFFFEESTK
jgi:hypothetical protein